MIPPNLAARATPPTHNQSTHVVLPINTPAEETDPDPPEPQTIINPVNNPVEETINPIVEHDNTNPGQDIASTPPRENPRPHRIRRPSDRLTY